MAQIKSTQELYDIFVTAAQDQADDLTDTEEGSLFDILAGVTAHAVNECNELILDEFRKTFFRTAHGPEITQGADDLQNLAVDHFGDDFARPEASNAQAVVTFSRPTSDAGAVAIPADTIVKTAPNANGVAQRFKTLIAVTLTALTVNASVEALEAGEEGNVEAGEINEIESTLLDSTITVSNASPATGGAPEEDDATYRETIRNLITSIRGATKAAVEAKALTVSGVETATAIETLKAVIEYDIANDAMLGSFFRIPYVSLYIADANGTADDALVASVREAVDNVRAAGVQVNIFGATALTVNWTASMTLNPAGPNFSTLSEDTTLIKDSMESYINALAIGSDFVRADAEDAIMAIWGPSGTNDLTDFATSIPSGDVSIAASEKAIAGTMEIV
jgi:hypothetical protein